jgi:hypothetical protein
MKTVGMAFLDGQVEIVNHSQWRHVSMLERAGTKMPATSNAIESLNSHLNGITRRSNAFWGSLTRLANITLRKWEGFHRCLLHNFHYECRKAVRRHTAIATDQMDRELAFFQTNDVACLSGGVKLAWDMYRILVPCSHQFALLVRANPDLQRHPLQGMPTEPPIPELAISDLPWNPGTIVYIFDQQVSYCPREPHFQHDIDRIAKKIVQGAHGYQKREEIKQWVITIYRTSREFALVETTAFWWMVEMGIQIFRNAA